MANKQRLRAHEALNVDVSAGWDVKDTVTVTTGTEKTLTVAPGTDTLQVSSTNSIYFTWTENTTDAIDQDNDLFLGSPNIITGQVIYELKVPRGLDTPVFHFLGNSNTANVRIVEQ